MQNVTTSDLWRVFNPLRLAGPIFDKELRVASRRRWTYLLRFAYIGLFSVYILSVWLPAVSIPQMSSSAVIPASQMGTAAIRIVQATIWFQFLASQVLAIVLLSGAVGDEIRKGSLDALLVSPISSLQIVLGKLFSRLLQLVLLLAASLPLLALVRVFGGVPWNYIVSSLCITLTAAFVTGSLSLFLSNAGNWNTVASRTLSWLFLAWAVIPAVFMGLHRAGYIGSSTGQTALYLSNPVYALADQSQALMAPGSRPILVLRQWPLHCLTMLAVAAVIVLLSARRMRRTALAPVAGSNEPKQGQGAKPTAWDRLSRRTIRRITGSPVAWREMKRPVFPRGRKGLVQMILLVLAACGAAGALIFLFVRVQDSIGPVCIAIAALLQIVFVFNATLGAASTITREKEARTLPILLTIPCDSGKIIKDKTIGILRRNLPFLIPVPLLAVLAYLLTPGMERNGLPLAVAAWFEVGWAGSMIFLIGLGLCLSAYFKTTTPAVVLTFGLFVGAKICLGMFLLPLAFMAFGTILQRHTTLAVVIATLVQAVVYAGIGIVLGGVAGGALRPNCQK